MYLRSLAMLLFCSLALGQASSSPKPQQKPGAPPATGKAGSPTSGGPSAVTPNAPVITIGGVCDTPKTAAKPATDCKTVVTRAQFERLANALQPNMPPNIQRRLGDFYPRIILMGREAQRRGLEQSQDFKDMLQFMKLQALAQELSRTLKDEADKVPEPEIENYYKANAANFEQASLLRLFIPKEKQSESAAEEEKKEDAKSAEAEKAAQETMQKEAQTLRERAAAGEDFDKLQKEAYEAAGVNATPPPTALGKLTRNELPTNHHSVVDLAAGQVSSLFTEANGYYVYKVVAKDTKSLKDAHDQIRTLLAQQRFQAAVDRIQSAGKIELNEAYFGGAAPPAPRMQPPAGQKPDESTPQPPK